MTGKIKPYDDSDLFGKISWEHAPTNYVNPKELIKGAAFIDRILPMPTDPDELRSDVWGAPNTKPRNINNDH